MGNRPRFQRKKHIQLVQSETASINMAKCAKCNKELYPDDITEDLDPDVCVLINMPDRNIQDRVDIELCHPCFDLLIAWLQSR